MNIRSFLSGTLDLVGAFVPSVAIAAKAVNAFLPDDKKMDEKNTTGRDILNAFNGLGEGEKATIEKRFEVEMAEIHASVDKLQAMVSAETPTANMRPKIAYMMAWTVFIAVCGMMLIWAVAVVMKDSAMLKELKESWELMLVLLGTPTALLRAYFGMRTKEKQARYAAATGQPIADVVGGVMGFLRK
ncbi:hypothetical protein [Marinomonas sp. BSi20584]|uniref:hypothetical protein n=1 Tax=Marinomonas sp. BSi20584 TaxID=1594462 RepID=UPI000C1EA9BD|nr:hypothetical protein [Marinomonas sp. BSi20584]PJE55646.1 hypothetical protein TY87_09305 [Marinomonas sp. BSi20584]